MRMMRLGRIALVFVAMAAVLGCSDAAEPRAVDPCLLEQEIYILTDEPPRFTWEPTCRMAILYVRPEAGGNLNWWIEADTNHIQSGITYGEAPPEGIIDEVGPTDLTPGANYVVTLVRRYGTGDNDLVAVGARVFSVGLTKPPEVAP